MQSPIRSVHLAIPISLAFVSERLSQIECELIIRRRFFQRWHDIVCRMLAVFKQLQRSPHSAHGRVRTNRGVPLKSVIDAYGLIVHILIAAIIVGLLLWILRMIPIFGPYMHVVRIVVITELLPFAGIR